MARLDISGSAAIHQSIELQLHGFEHDDAQVGITLVADDGRVFRVFLDEAELSLLDRARSADTDLDPSLTT